MKFTPIKELNDPTELAPVMDRRAAESSLTALRKSGITQDQFEWLHRQKAILDLLAPGARVLDAPKTLQEANRLLLINAYEDIDHMERELFEVIETIRSKVGVFSVSERFDSLPMWVHYANFAKGFVIVLEGLEKSFMGDDTGSLNIPKPVVYEKRFTGMTFDPSTQDRLFFSKLFD